MQEKRAVTIPAAVVISVVILAGATLERFGLPDFTLGPLSYNAAEYQQATADPTDKDTDGDGLKDWEEELWNTDPENPDTDEDGTSDYTETVTGRDPLTPGPYDVTDGTKLPLSTKLVRDAVSGYAALRENGEVSQAEEEAFVADLATQYTSPPSAVQYTVNDLTLVEDTPANIQVYRKTLAETFLTFDQIKERETNILLGVLTNNRHVSELEKIDDAVTIYNQAVARLIATPIPQSAAGIHIEFVNSLSAISTTLAATRLAVADPLQAMVSIHAFPNIEGEFIAATVALTEYLAQN